MWETEHERLRNKLVRMSAMMKNWVGTTTKLYKYRLTTHKQTHKDAIKLDKTSALINHRLLYVLWQGHTAMLQKHFC